MTHIPPLPLDALSENLGQNLLKRGWRIATAESCTGGGIAAAITAIAGSSVWFEYGVVSYADSAKEKLLGVKQKILADKGAVSEAVVLAMVDGILALSGADIAVAVSGIAGPSGGSIEKPVGTVWFGWGLKSGERHSEVCHFAGERTQIQTHAIAHGLRGLYRFLT